MAKTSGSGNSEMPGGRANAGWEAASPARTWSGAAPAAGTPAAGTPAAGYGTSSTTFACAMLLSPMASAVASANLFTMLPSIFHTLYRYQGQEEGAAGDAFMVKHSKTLCRPTFDSCRKGRCGKHASDSQSAAAPC